MFSVDYFIPTRIIFGAGCLNKLATTKMPGKKALICITADGLMEELGILERVIEYFNQNKTRYVIFNKVVSNPIRKTVMEAKELAVSEGCDFTVGLGGGSSIDTAKAAAIMMRMEGDLWDYAYAGTGKKKVITDAAPVVAISTTAGTGTETDLGV